jgi:hypothetical protein
MNPPRFTDLDYITFLLASPRAASATEIARTFAGSENPCSHDAITRFLHRTSPSTEVLWQEAKTLLDPKKGCLVLDDSTIDKKYAPNIELVTKHWSGKHHAVVEGINLLTLLWTDGQAKIPCDFRIYDKKYTGKTKNDSFREMLEVARSRGFEPEYILFDTWYASLDNLKAIRGLGWKWLSRFAHNRNVSTEEERNIPISTITIPEKGREVYLTGYGKVRVFKVTDKEGKAAYWATNDLDMQEEQRKTLGKQGWEIEVYHRGLKQCCLVERCQHRSGHAQRVHILMSIRTFLRLEVYRLKKGVSWYEAKLEVIRKAVGEFVKKPFLSVVIKDPCST